MTNDKSLWQLHNDLNEDFSKLESLIDILSHAAMSGSVIREGTLNYYTTLMVDYAEKTRSDIDSFWKYMETNKAAEA